MGIGPLFVWGGMGVGVLHSSIKATLLSWHCGWRNERNRNFEVLSYQIKNFNPGLCATF